MLGEEHPDTATSIGDVALLYYRQGKIDEAEPVLAKALENERRVEGQEMPPASIYIPALLHHRRCDYDCQVAEHIYWGRRYWAGRIFPDV